MNKKEVLKIIFILVIILLIVVSVILIVNSKKKKQNTVVTNNDEVQLQELQVKEVDVMEPEIIETREVISIPELTQSTYYIKVNNQMNTVTIYIKDENGEYTIPVKAMVCSIGEDTPQNCKYVLSYKRWEWQPLFGNVYGQYATHINSNILFHSVPYTEKKKDTLEYWEYDKLGTTASAGCVRLTVGDAKWIYNNCLSGSIVEFYSSSDPGPLGKPKVDPISEYEEYRNWDPTDPDENNPWKKE